MRCTASGSCTIRRRARTVQAAKLPRGALVEIDAVAVFLGGLMSTSSIEVGLTETRSFAPVERIRGGRRASAAWPTTRSCIGRADEIPDAVLGRRLRELGVDEASGPRARLEG
jgi:hypothetical protein